MYSEQPIETTSEKHNYVQCQSLLYLEKSKHNDVRRNEAELKNVFGLETENI